MKHEKPKQGDFPKLNDMDAWTESLKSWLQCNEGLYSELFVDTGILQYLAEEALKTCRKYAMKEYGESCYYEIESGDLLPYAHSRIQATKCAVSSNEKAGSRHYNNTPTDDSEQQGNVPEKNVPSDYYGFMKYVSKRTEKGKPVEALRRIVEQVCGSIADVPLDALPYLLKEDPGQENSLSAKEFLSIFRDKWSKFVAANRESENVKAAEELRRFIYCEEMLCESEQENQRRLLAYLPFISELMGLGQGGRGRSDFYKRFEKCSVSKGTISKRIQRARSSFLAFLRREGDDQSRWLLAKLESVQQNKKIK